MKAELQELVALQNLDTTIRRLQKELEAIPERRAEVESEFDQRAFEIRALENRRDEAEFGLESKPDFQNMLSASFALGLQLLH